MLLAVFLPERIAQSLPQHHAGKLLRDRVKILLGGDPHLRAVIIDVASHFLVFFVIFPLAGQLRVHLFLRNGQAALLRLIEHDEVQQDLIQRIRVADGFVSCDIDLVLLFIRDQALVDLRVLVGRDDRVVRRLLLTGRQEKQKQAQRKHALGSHRVLLSYSVRSQRVAFT